jgi:putative photosynthetic complex assembly protein
MSLRPVHTANGTTFPRALLFGLAGVVLASLAAVGFGASTGIGRVELPLADGPAVAQRDLRFDDRDDGGISVRDADDGSLVAAVEPATGGFLRATMRGLVRERKRQGIGPEMPFRLALGTDGRLVLADPATGRIVDLRAFGPTNHETFARLLPEMPAALVTFARGDLK